MKLVALALVLAACQSKSQPPAGSVGSAVSAGSASSTGTTTPGSAGSAAPTPAPVAPPVQTAQICIDTLTTLDQATCARNDAGLRAARTSVAGIINTMTKVGNADPQTYDIMCARLLLALERDVGSAGCTLPIAPQLRERVQRQLDAFFSQRTPVTKTGDTASDDVIGKLAAVRDAACDCRTSACIDKLDAQLAAVPQLPASAPQAARDLGSKLLDDSARCAQRARMNP